jgi:hypothetical protein
MTKVVGDGYPILRIRPDHLALNARSPDPFVQCFGRRVLSVCPTNYYHCPTDYSPQALGGTVPPSAQPPAGLGIRRCLLRRHPLVMFAISLSVADLVACPIAAHRSPRLSFRRPTISPQIASSCPPAPPVDFSVHSLVAAALTTLQ